MVIGFIGAGLFSDRLFYCAWSKGNVPVHTSGIAKDVYISAC